MARRAHRSRASRLEDAGQMRLNLDDEIGWAQRLAKAYPLRLPLRPGATLESDYRNWWPILGTPSGWPLLARMRRRSDGNGQLLASSWLPWLYVSVCLRRAS